MSCDRGAGAGRDFPEEARRTARHLRLPPLPASVRQARRFVRDSLDGVDADTVHAVLLVVSELVTNGVVHARTELEVAVAVAPDRVLVAVGDRDLVTPEHRPYSPDRPGGRGMAMVGDLSEAWGTETSTTGKTVWSVVRRVPDGAATLAGGGR